MHICPHIYRTQSGGRSKHTAHSFDELSSDSVFDRTVSNDPTSREGPTGAGTWLRGPDGVEDVAGTERRGIVATACVGGAGYEVIPVSSDEGKEVCGSMGSLRGAE